MTNKRIYVWVHFADDQTVARVYNDGNHEMQFITCDIEYNGGIFKPHDQKIMITCTIQFHTSKVILHAI